MNKSNKKNIHIPIYTYTQQSAQKKIKIRPSFCLDFLSPVCELKCVFFLHYFVWFIRIVSAVFVLGIYLYIIKIYRI